MDSGNTTDTPIVEIASTEEVTVEKCLTTESDRLVCAKFRLTARTTPRIVRIVEDLPEGVDEGEVGFDPDRRGGDWRFENGRLWFTTVIDDDSVDTIYGVRNADEAAIETLSGSPEIAAVLPVDDTTGGELFGDSSIAIAAVGSEQTVVSEGGAAEETEG